MAIKFKEGTEIKENELRSLYNDVGWTAYTDDMPRLINALHQSLYVLSAWDESKLIGLIRLIGDGQTVIYIQDILVLGAYQNNGIGSQLMSQVLEKYYDVRQKVLLTDDAPDVRSFYKKHGFFSCDQGRLVAFAHLN